MAAITRKGHGRARVLAEPERRDQVYPRAEVEASGSECEGSGYSEGSGHSPCSDFTSRSQDSDGHLAFLIGGSHCRGEVAFLF